jgi:hypothetical protein
VAEPSLADLHQSDHLGLEPKPLPERRTAVAEGKHTPTPWYVGPMNDALYIIDQPPRPVPIDTMTEIEHNKTRVIARVVWDAPSAMTEANAAFIVLAVNMHAALVTALKAMREEIDGMIDADLHAVCSLGPEGPKRETAEPEDLRDVERLEAMRAQCDALLSKTEGAP